MFLINHQPEIPGLQWCITPPRSSQEAYLLLEAARSDCLISVLQKDLAFELVHCNVITLQLNRTVLERVEEDLSNMDEQVGYVRLSIRKSGYSIAAEYAMREDQGLLQCHARTLSRSGKCLTLFSLIHLLNTAFTSRLEFPCPITHCLRCCPGLTTSNSIIYHSSVTTTNSDLNLTWRATVRVTMNICTSLSTGNAVAIMSTRQAQFSMQILPITMSVTACESLGYVVPSWVLSCTRLTYPRSWGLSYRKGLVC